ncbi:toll/interleukin-1 receptor domain-containing protein [Brevibacillus sp. SYP-B805]|uniref:toll/interleukin-1 receptor domain-containing protein n=1 Tax=Brevibacillus sp. SYP-B805 TaxID=1578199 RepID=UPI0013EB8FFF|nr:toll/interleukin-1 receptor domain-containing protein [Brevibacillus sp. SYP-B805]NGQ96599.1 toll/interleukin-1 receptor domain-containing protein [Brevibacillus sp. SYP-B805]
MKQIERFQLIDKIARKLQEIMTYDDIDIFLSGFGITNYNLTRTSFNSKWVYAKELLKNVDNIKILKIADELGIDHPFSVELSIESSTVQEIPDFWKRGYFKLFLSHLASFKEQTAKLQKSLLKYGISAFVAHEDIEPTREWLEEIEKALFTMDALVAILTPGFNESKWTDQEIGIAMGRNVLVIPIRKGMDPYGFFGKYQGFQGEGKTIAEVAHAIFKILITHNKTKEKMMAIIVDLFLFSKNEDEADNYLKLIEEIDDLPKRFAEKIKDNSLNNESIFKSTKIMKRINKILDKYGLLVGPQNNEIEIVDDNLPF